MKRPFRAVVLVVLAFLLLGPVPNSMARSGPRVPAGRNVATPKAIELPEGYAAYGTGTIVHADALRLDDPNALVDADVAFAAAAFSSDAPTEKYVNEVHRIVTGKLDKFGVDKNSYGRGAGLELGIASPPNPLIGQLTEASAPAPTELLHNKVGPIVLGPILRAELLRSQAQARSAEGCVLGKDLSFGLGSVLNLELLGGLVATHTRWPYREVAQSNSTTRIVQRPSDGQLGLKSETRQTIAPVSFFNGAFTIEVLGEWALRAVTFGDDSYVHYGPINTSPQTPVVRVLDSKGETIIQVTSQMLLGKKGVGVKIGDLAELMIGEDPRMIGDSETSDPLEEDGQVAAAADVVRVRLLKGALADVRVGHMEAAATVPNSEGVQCPGLIVDQTVDKPTVTTEEPFTYTITIKNPNDCVVTDLKLVDTATLPAGVTISLTPGVGGNATANVVTFPDLGSLGPGETKTITITSKVPLGSAEGLIKALAVADGLCPAEVQPPNDTDGPTPGTPEMKDIPVRGEDSVDGPTVDTCIVPDVKGEALAEAIKAITDAGCVVGETTEDPDADPDDEGKITDQGPDKPGDSVPKGTPVDITVGGDLCIVPSVIGQTTDAADDALEAAGCDLGDTTEGSDNTGPPGTITTQNPGPGEVVLSGTDVDVVTIPAGDTNLIAASTSCNVPGLIGLTEADARSKVEQAGCVLVTEPKNTPNSNELGKVMTQNPGADAVVPRGSTVKVGIGVQVLGETLTNSQNEAADAAPNLARTGGLFLGGLSLWLLLGGLAARAAGSNRLWRLLRRRDG